MRFPNLTRGRTLKPALAALMLLGGCCCGMSSRSSSPAPPPAPVSGEVWSDEQIKDVWEREQAKPWQEIYRFSGEGDAWSEPFTAQDVTICIICYPAEGQSLGCEVEKQGDFYTSFTWPMPHLEGQRGQFVMSRPGDLFRLEVRPHDPGPWTVVVQSK